MATLNSPSHAADDRRHEGDSDGLVTEEQFFEKPGTTQNRQTIILSDDSDHRENHSEGILSVEDGPFLDEHVNPVNRDDEHHGQGSDNKPDNLYQPPQTAPSDHHDTQPQDEKADVEVPAPEPTHWQDYAMEDAPGDALKGPETRHEGTPDQDDSMVLLDATHESLKSLDATGRDISPQDMSQAPLPKKKKMKKRLKKVRRNLRTGSEADIPLDAVAPQHQDYVPNTQDFNHGHGFEPEQVQYHEQQHPLHVDNYSKFDIPYQHPAVDHDLASAHAQMHPDLHDATPDGHIHSQNNVYPHLSGPPVEPQHFRAQFPYGTNYPDLAANQHPFDTTAYPADSHERSDDDPPQCNLITLVAPLQAIVEKNERDRRNANRRRQNAEAANILLQDRVVVLQREKQELEAQRQDKALKATKLQKFVNGMVGDYDGLRRDAGSQRLRIEQLADDVKKRHDLQEAMILQLRESAEESSRLKHKALRTAQEFKEERDSTMVKLEHAQNKLNEKSQQLNEEKNALVRLHDRLIAAESIHETVQRKLDAGKNEILDKLAVMHATVEGMGGQATTSLTLEKIIAAAQSLSAAQSSSTETMLSVKGMVEALSENISTCNNSNDQPDDGAIIARFDEALSNLKFELCNFEKLTCQQNADRETIATLREALKASDARAVELKSQLESAQASEAQLQAKNTQLESGVARLQSELAPLEGLQAEVEKLKAELESQSMSLDSINRDLTAKSDDLASLQAAKAELEEENRALQQSLSDVGNTAATEDSVDLAHQIQLAREEERAKVTEESKRLHESSKASWANKEKTITKARNDSQAKFKVCQIQLGEANAQLERLRTTSSSKDSEIQAKLLDTEQVAEERRQRIDSLQASIAELKEELENAVDPDDYDEVRGELDEQKGEMARLQARIDDFKRGVEAKEHTISNLRDKLFGFEAIAKDPTALHEKLRRIQDEHDAMTRQLTDKHSSIVEQIGADWKKASDKEQQKLQTQHNEVIRELQRLNSVKCKELEARAKDLEAKVETNENFRDNVKRSWDRERNEQQQLLAQARGGLASLEAERDEAHAAKQRMQEQMQQESRRAELLLQENKRLERLVATVNEFNSADANHENSLRSQIQVNEKSQSQDMSLPSNFGAAIWSGDLSGHPMSSQTTQARRIVNRHAEGGPVIEESQHAPLAQMNAPNSRFSATAYHNDEETPGPIVEESQQGFTMADFQLPSSSNGSDKVESQLQPWPKSNGNHVAPSFARFNASQAFGPKPSAYQAQDFSIYDAAEESQEHYHLSQDSNGQKKKRVPAPPNSASKRLSSDRRESQTMRVFGTELPILGSQQSDRQLQTPEPRASSRGPLMQSQHRSHSAMSSSPAFVANSQPNRTSQTYHGSGSAKKRSTSRQVLDSAAGSYQHDRKRRLETQSSDVASKSRRTSLRSHSQTSHGTMLHPNREMPPSSSQGSRVPPAQSRMRTLAGNSTQKTRGSSKSAKGDEMNARFAQELGKRKR